MIGLQIDQMSRAEKVMAMEVLWKDLSREEESFDSPTWHAEELKATQDRVESGGENPVDWEAAKKGLRQQFE